MRLHVLPSVLLMLAFLLGVNGFLAFLWSLRSDPLLGGWFIGGAIVALALVELALLVLFWALLTGRI